MLFLLARLKLPAGYARLWVLAYFLFVPLTLIKGQALMGWLWRILSLLDRPTAEPVRCQAGRPPDNRYRDGLFAS
jgi:hypothetical protein